MNKNRYALWTSTIFAASLLLSGCQSLTGYQKIEEAESAKVWAGKIEPIAGEVNIACVGTYHCEIMQIDRTLVISPDSHEPINPAMLVAMPSSDGVKKTVKAPMNMDMTPLVSKNSIKIVPLSASAMPGLTNYYARVMPAKREVHVNFYPENNRSYIERFAMIHDFVEPGTYRLRAYQKRSDTNSGSLLETASPEPLCIDLLQGSQVQRRFCKQLGAERQGEFIETGTFEVSPTASKSKAIKA
ncbi:hypothetical protein ACT3TH_00970 [Psychrobacter sp. AOP22-C1-C5]|uniref:hypothetical protein n=1 Tax=Psychrobacter sp. AOP22-C1-C5 TaxID=3457716 RepID=UPI0040369B6C